MIAELMKMFKSGEEMTSFFDDLRNFTAHFDGDAGMLHDIKDLKYLIDEVIEYLEEFKK